MQPNTNALERAFELARCGTCTSIKEIKQRLNVRGPPVRWGLWTSSALVRPHAPALMIRYDDVDS